MSKTADGMYTSLETHRASFLEHARSSAKLTIPALLPPHENMEHQVLPTPWQSLGARGVNNLASKFLLTLFPPNTPFFRQMPDDAIVKEMRDAGDQDVKTEIEKALGDFERAVQSRVETRADRVQWFEALKHLIVAGNICVHIPKKDTLKLFRMDKYVVKRAPNGDILDAIIRESIALSQLPETVQEVVKGKLAIKGASAVNTSHQKTDYLFTVIKYVAARKQFQVHQEVQGIRIPGSQGQYPKDKLPWLFLRYSKIDGEDYGRGFVEEYYGDLNSLERLTKAVVEGAVAAAKVLFLISPNGTTRAKVLEKAPNGAIREGDMKDVTVLQLDKFADFRIAKDMIAEIKEQLAYAFLLNSSVQRKGERVTAEEIRYMAGELEDALGGAYSTLSLELQLPYVNRLIDIMQAEGKLPHLPKDSVRPTIVTGLEALGRGHDLRKLDMFIQGMAESLGPEVLAQHMHIGDYIKRRATAVGIETEGLIKTAEELQAEQEAAQQAQQQGVMQQMIEKLGPEAMKQVGAMQQGEPAQ